MNRDFDINNLVRSNVLKLQPYSSARDEFKADGKDMTFLDANENPYGSGLNRYPDPKQGNLKSRLAALKGVREQEILLGNGSDEVLDLLFRAFCEPKEDNIITLPPTYGMYKVLANINEVEEREVILNTDFQPDVEAILNKTDEKSKILFLCSPNNPTGNDFSENAVLRLLEAFPGLVVIDEAYIDFSVRESWLLRLEKYPNLVITQTMSKAWGLAGIRLGICYASEEIIHILNKIKPPYNVNELTGQKAGERLLEVGEVQSEIKKIRSQKERLYRALSHLNIVEKIFPSDANFLLVRMDNANLRYQQLLQRNIVVRNRSNQALCENTIRFTIGTKDENEKLITALQDMNKEK